jgi:hypothetical protein
VVCSPIQRRRGGGVLSELNFFSAGTQIGFNTETQKETLLRRPVRFLFFRFRIQGCQMVYFQTKNPNFGELFWALN